MAHFFYNCVYRDRASTAAFCFRRMLRGGLFLLLSPGRRNISTTHSWEHFLSCLYTRCLMFKFKWGIILLKYVTVVVSDHAELFIFINPWCVPTVPDVQSGIWYLEHPLRGILIAGHVFHAFNVEYPFTYVYNSNPFYSLPVSFAMWIETVIGMFNGLKKNFEFFSAIGRSVLRH